MKYIDSLNLINLCIKHNILNTVDKKVLVYRKKSKHFPEGWYATDKDLLAKELMKDEVGQNALISVLKNKNVVVNIL